MQCYIDLIDNIDHNRKNVSSVNDQQLIQCKKYIICDPVLLDQVC